jgi:hypothetical protein
LSKGDRRSGAYLSSAAHSQRASVSNILLSIAPRQF